MAWKNYRFSHLHHEALLHCNWRPQPLTTPIQSAVSVQTIFTEKTSTESGDYSKTKSYKQNCVHSLSESSPADVALSTSHFMQVGEQFRHVPRNIYTIFDIRSSYKYILLTRRARSICIRSILMTHSSKRIFALGCQKEGVWLMMDEIIRVERGVDVWMDM